MRDLSKALVACLALGAMAPAAMAQPAAKAPRPPAAVNGTTGDVRCLMAMFALSQQKDQRQATAGAFGIYFFTGRLSAHAGLNLVQAIRSQAPTMGGPQIQAELARCGPIFQSSVQAAQAGFSALRPPGAPPPAGAAPSAPAPAAPAPAPAQPAPATPPPK